MTSHVYGRQKIGQKSEKYTNHKSLNNVAFLWCRGQPIYHYGWANDRYIFENMLYSKLPMTSNCQCDSELKVQTSLRKYSSSSHVHAVKVFNPFLRTSLIDDLCILAYCLWSYCKIVPYHIPWSMDYYLQHHSMTDFMGAWMGLAG